jgi:hypothetical protein
VRIPTVNDVIRAGAEQVTALAALPGTLVQLNRSLASLADTAARLDQLVRRLDRLTAPLEAPLAALAPRLEALVPLLDEDLIRSLPALLDSLRRNAVPTLELMGQTQAHVAAITSSMERLTSMMDEGLTRLQDLPGAALVSRLRPGGSPVDTGRGGGAVTEGPEPGAAPGRPARPSRASRTTEEHRSWRG